MVCYIAVIHAWVGVSNSYNVDMLKFPDRTGTQEKAFQNQDH